MADSLSTSEHGREISDRYWQNLTALKTLTEGTFAERAAAEMARTVETNKMHENVANIGASSASNVANINLTGEKYKTDAARPYYEGYGAMLQAHAADTLYDTGFKKLVQPQMLEQVKNNLTIARPKARVAELQLEDINETAEEEYMKKKSKSALDTLMGGLLDNLFPTILSGSTSEQDTADVARYW